MTNLVNTCDYSMFGFYTVTSDKYSHLMEEMIEESRNALISNGFKFPKVIGVTGLPGAGKYTVCQILKEEIKAISNELYTTYDLINPIMKFAQHAYNLTNDQMRGMARYIPLAQYSAYSPDKLMQTMVDRILKHDSSYFIRAMILHLCPDLANVVINTKTKIIDMIPNEGLVISNIQRKFDESWVRQHDGIVIKVEKKSHRFMVVDSSEVEYDLVVQNDFASGGSTEMSMGMLRLNLLEALQEYQDTRGKYSKGN